MHVCCAPCTIYPLKFLRDCNHDVHGFFFNPNIHPYLEYCRRRDALRAYAEEENLPIIWKDNYDLEQFLRTVVFRESDRCRFCYYSRMSYAVHIAKKGKYDGFTSTLLYSKYQNHELIRSIGENLAKENGVSFIYHDFREGWESGIRISKSRGIYRQQYCGCIYSEKDRYYKQAPRQVVRESKTESGGFKQGVADESNG
ncbi:epoxyqueuosine reductase QueH [Syntrophus aciditrophicus]